MLDTFVLVHNGKTISPKLVTIREYGRWFEETFDKYTSTQELYLRAKNEDGEVVLESHPGTKIGNYFDKHSFNQPNLYSWYLSQDSAMMERLKKYKLAEKRDVIQFALQGKKYKMLRVYTVNQIELYIRTVVDKNFSIDKYIEKSSKKVCVKDSDFINMIRPKMESKRKTLF